MQQICKIGLGKVILHLEAFFFSFSLLCTQYKQIYALNSKSSLLKDSEPGQLLVNVWQTEISCSVFYKICANDFLMGSSQDEKNKQNNIRKNKLQTIWQGKSPNVDIFDERIKLLNWLLCGLCE